MSYADEREDAVLFENSGDDVSAIASYGKWVSHNPTHVDAVSTLIHASSLYQSPIEAIMFLSEYVRYLPENRADAVYAKMADIEALVGLPVDAAEHYELAARAGNVDSDNWLLKAAVLRLSMGELELSKQMAAQLASRSLNPELRDEASAISALSRAKSGEPEAALHELEDYLLRKGVPDSPLPYLAAKEIAESLNDVRMIDFAMDGLSAHFEGSAALYFAEKRLLEWTTPSALLRERITASSRPIQVGAFRGREGASELREQLENDGFTSWMENDGNLWRVFVNDSDGNAASRLAAAGYQASISGR